MDVISAILLILLCLLLGIIGQLARMVVNLKKDNDAFVSKGQENMSSGEKKIIEGLSGTLDDDKLKNIVEIEHNLYDSLNAPQKWNIDMDPVKKSLYISVFAGLVIGLLALLYESSLGKITIDVKFMAMIVATGYAGSDAVEGLYDSILIIFNGRKQGKKKQKVPENKEVVPIQRMNDL